MSAPLEATTETPSGFDRLLAALDADRDRAAGKFLVLRRKLLKYFAWNRAPFPEDLADETLDRVARRLAEGETIRQADPASYVHGVARNVLRESWTRARIAPIPEGALDASPESGLSAERRSRCLDRCLERLPEDSRRLVLGYYQEQGAAKIALRRQLAEDLGVSGGTLRLRLHRLRVELQGCVGNCVQGEAETETVPAHMRSRMRENR